MLPELRIQLTHTMQYIGAIHAPEGAPRLELDDWMTYINAANDLQPSPGRMCRNPANGESIMVRPPPNSVRYIVNGKEIGSFSWGPSEQNHIQIAHAQGHRYAVVDRAREIAKSLGCEIELWERHN